MIERGPTTLRQPTPGDRFSCLPARLARRACADRSASRSFMKIPGFLSWVLCAALLHGAACSSSNRDGERLLNAAALGDLARVKSLVEEGAPINYSRSEMTFGWTPLICATFHWKTNVIYYLVEKGADVNAVDRRGQTALMWMMVREDDEAVPIAKLLIKHGANVEVKDVDGGTVFDRTRSDEMIKVLEAARKPQKEPHKP